MQEPQTLFVGYESLSFHHHGTVGVEILNPLEAQNHSLGTIRNSGSKALPILGINGKGGWPREVSMRAVPGISPVVS